MNVSNKAVIDLLWAEVDLSRDAHMCERQVTTEGRYVTMERQTYMQLISSVVRMAAVCQSIKQETAKEPT
jgi:hypothetical protein